MYNGDIQIMQISSQVKKKFKCFIIEDACHAFGATYL